MKPLHIIILLLFISVSAFAQQVNVQIDANANRKNISAYIFGRNNNVSDDPSTPTTNWQMMHDAGLNFARENGGNNATKYNWRKKLSSHPDWYNNVFQHDWDYAAKTLQDSMPQTQGMWAFQLIGSAASNNNNNFNDWAYNSSQYWSGVCQNLAGGGVVNNGGSCAATTNGDTLLYLQKWNEDSTTAILNHWFGAGGLGLTSSNKIYWSMDNEPEIWNSTHDDVMPTQLSAEAFMQRYFKVAKKARALFPNIKLAGPIPATEWQWYAWNNQKITYNSQNYTWLEFFIKRCAEEQTASGIRLLDVIDIHSYPNETNDTDILQGHRIYFDTAYVYPGANGVKLTDPSGWGNNITNENVFGRVNAWLNQYFGANHGIKVGVSEYGINNNSAAVTANAYASTLGTFANNGVEYFSPWFWYPGMWEVMHLFSHYGKNVSVQSVSSNEKYLSAFTSVNTANDSMTIILVNRSLTDSMHCNVQLNNFNIANGNYTTALLNNLPSIETFVSHSQNALKAGIATISNNLLHITIPPLSIQAVLLKSAGGSGINGFTEVNQSLIVYPNPCKEKLSVIGYQFSENTKVEVLDVLGRSVFQQVNKSTTQQIQIDVSGFSKGIYFLKATNDKGLQHVAKFVKH